MHKRGFTLIELLVVISVISVLAAILFPVFARARENGRRAACQSNLRQIGMGLLQYSQDYDEHMIADWYGRDATTGKGETEPRSTPGGNYKWMDAAYSYIKNEQVFVCPSDSADTRHNAKYIYYGNLAANSDKDYGSYIINHGYGPNVAGRTPAVSHMIPASPDIVKQSQAVQPAETVWVVDGGENFYLDIKNSPSILAASPRTLDNAKEPHLETMNILFIDGHVKAKKLDYLLETGTNGVVYKHFTMEDD
jgi:prepilin-type N-terminal cleavage/methylation domain-containing protein/prepilin-type processing-associated H-X9-DG protein